MASSFGKERFVAGLVVFSGLVFCASCLVIRAAGPVTGRSGRAYVPSNASATDAIRIGSELFLVSVSILAVAIVLGLVFSVGWSPVRRVVSRVRIIEKFVVGPEGYTEYGGELPAEEGYRGMLRAEFPDGHDDELHVDPAAYAVAKDGNLATLVLHGQWVRQLTDLGPAPARAPVEGSNDADWMYMDPSDQFWSRVVSVGYCALGLGALAIAALAVSGLRHFDFTAVAAIALGGVYAAASWSKAKRVWVEGFPDPLPERLDV